VWPFFLGFLLGVLLCLGAGGTFVVMVQRRSLVEAEMMRREAEEAAMHEAMARKEAEAMRLEAEARKQQLEKGLAEEREKKKGKE
jgi:hypothetical protein